MDTGFAGSDFPTAEKMLRQTQAMRHIVGARAKGNIKVPEPLGTGALNKLLPKGATNEHQQE